MPPKSLIFCADSAALRVLEQVFVDMDLQPEVCSDIFSALEALTSRDFEVVAVDWTENAEAAFLLKTAAELKTRLPFALAVTNDGNAQAACSAGAHVIVTKPLNIEITKRALLNSDEFLGRMRNWLPLPEQATFTGLPKLSALNVNKAANPLTVTDLPPLDVYAAQVSAAEASEQSVQVYARSSRVPPLDWWILGAIATAALAFGAFELRLPQARQDLLAALHSRAAVNQAYEQAVEDDTHYLSDDSELLPAAHPRHWAPKATRVIQQPSDRISSPEIPSSALPQSAPAVGDAVASGLVPESLNRPVPQPPISRVVLEGGSPAAYGTLQPVNLPEDSAEKLLVKRVQPSYSAQELSLGLEGPVVFEASIARDGSVQELKLVRGPIGLVQDAYKAAKQWRFRPYTPNGEATEARTFVTIDFQRTQLASFKP
jgi:Gram-negative bacterial TonB protein C-terminal